MQHRPAQHVTVGAKWGSPPPPSPAYFWEDPRRNVQAHRFADLRIRRFYVQGNNSRQIIMTQNKAAKRKRNAKAQQAQKMAKLEPAAAAPITTTAADLEPQSLHSVISEEELEIATDTLATLAKYPNLTKSKHCKDLRVAVYEFRQSCTTGVNSAGTLKIHHHHCVVRALTYTARRGSEPYSPSHGRPQRRKISRCQDSPRRDAPAKRRAQARCPVPLGARPRCRFPA